MIKKLTSLIIAIAMAATTLTTFAENADTTVVSDTTAEEQVTVTEEPAADVVEETPELPGEPTEEANTADDSAVEPIMKPVDKTTAEPETAMEYTEEPTAEPEMTEVTEFPEVTETVSEEPTAEPEEDHNLFIASTSGTCGDNLTWKLEDGTLIISGTGGK